MVKSGLQRRLLETHLLIAFSGTFFILVLYISTSVIGKTAARYSENIGIVNQSILPLIHNMQYSIDANHGWVTVGDEEFLEKNKQAWIKIEKHLDELVLAYRKVGKTNYQQMVDDIESKVIELSNLQLAIDLIDFQQKENAIKRMYIQVMESKSVIFDVLDQLQVSTSNENDGSFDKLINDIDVNVKDNISLVELMLSQQGVAGTNEYSNYRSLKSHLYQLLNSIEKLTVTVEPTNELISQLVTLTKNLSVLLDEIVDDYSVANNIHVRDFLFHQAIPLTDEVVILLNQFEVKMTTDAMQRQEELNELVKFSLTLAFAGMVGLVLAAVTVSILNARKMISKITELSSALENFAKNGEEHVIQVEGDDEISTLARLFNYMMYSISAKQNTLKRYQSELEDRVEQRTEELYQLKEFAETTLRSIGDASIVVDKEQMITMFNPAAEELFQISSDKVVGHPVDEPLKLRCMNSDRIHKPVTQCLKEGIVISSVKPLNLVRSKQAQMAVKVSVAPITLNHGVVDGAIVIIRDVTLEQQLQTKLFHKANHDALTGLSNRSHFNSRLKSLLDGAEGKIYGVIAFLDLDNFKAVNDSAGHMAGDELLRQLTEIMKDAIRDSDTVARLGGDEFALILKNCSLDQAEIICNRLRDEISDFCFVWDNRAYSVGVSIGLTQIDSSSSSLSNLLAEADAACYQAKNSGKNMVCISENITPPSDGDAFSGKERILEAFDQSRFVIELDELVSSRLNEQFSFQTVNLDFEDKSARKIPFKQYLQIIERHRDMAKVDAYKMMYVIEKLTDQEESDESNRSYYIKLNAASVLDRDFQHILNTSLLSKDAVNTHRILLGIPESLLIENLLLVRALLVQWEALGIQIVIENCGGNLAAFRFLKDLPVQYFAVDKRFTLNLVDDMVNRTIVRAVCDLARLSGKLSLSIEADTEGANRELIGLGIDILLTSFESASTETKALALKRI